MDSAYRTKTMVTAWDLWDEFLRYRTFYNDERLCGSAAPSGILTSEYPRNECAVQFFRYCAQLFTGSDGEVWNYNLRTAVPDHSGRAVSWLWNLPDENGKVRPVVTIDAEYLADETTDLYKTWTRLLLHETGHLVLHWESFESQRLAGRIPDATSDQESEAWWFCIAVMGCAVCNHAPRQKIGPPPAHEEAWRLL
jgi:hypothetical protein